MVKILVKSFVTDATVSSPQVKQPLSRQDSINYYSWAFEPMGYSEQQFENSLKYYSKNPENLNRILDKVINELAKLETETGASQLVTTDTTSNSLPNLWTEKTSWALPTDGQYNLIQYKIPVIGPGVYTLSADIRVFPDDESINPGMLCYFFYDDGTEHGNKSGYKTVGYKKDGELRTVSIENTLTKSDVTHIMGYIMDHSPREGDWSKHSEVTNICIRFSPLPSTLEPRKVVKPLSTRKKDVEKIK